MTVEAKPILDPYLATLEAELRDLAPSDRAEIILEVREHFEDARGELANPSESDLRNILELLGPPSEIATEALLRFGVTRSDTGGTATASPQPQIARPGGLEYAAIILWVIWWPLGVLLTAISPRWTRRDKAIAILVQLVGVAVIGGVFLTPVYFGEAAFGHAYIFLLAVLLFPPTLAGLVGAGYLAWKLVSPAPRAWSEPWRIAGRAAALLIGAWVVWALLLGPLLLGVMKVRGG